MPKLIFPNGVATPFGACIIAQASDESGNRIAGNLIIRYRFDGTATAFGTDWTVISICCCDQGNAIYAAGENGEIIRIAEGNNLDELIDPKNNGPAEQGPIRELRSINSRIYAVGMGRQIYKRNLAGEWLAIDDGIVDKSGESALGLTSIAGDESGFLVSVGYGGEIWEYDGSWMQIASPTNLLLSRVVLHNGKYYAAGLAGVLLCRESTGWRVIDTQDFGLDVWDLETYRGSLYLGTTRGLFQLTDEEEVAPLDPGGFIQRIRCTSLSADVDRLWCFGASVVASTTDGVTWQKVKIL